MIVRNVHKHFFSFIAKNTSYSSVLCLDGELPSKEFFKDLNLPIVALDGAGNSLMEIGVVPNIVVGDMDSLNRKYHDILQTFQIKDQDKSDFQKGIEYLKNRNLMPAIILGVNGGYLDHVLNNINIFLETDCICYAPPLVCFVLKNSDSFNFPINTKISLIGIPSARVTSQGLKWELNDAFLEFPGVNSTFNRTVEKNIIIEVSSGNLLVMVYSEKVIDAGLF